MSHCIRAGKLTAVGVEAASGPECPVPLDEVGDCPAYGTLVVPVAWRTHVEEDRGIDEVVQDAEEDVPVSALRDAEPDEVEDTAGDGVADRLQSRGRHRHDLSSVVAHGGHVLDDDEGRSEYLGGPRGAQARALRGPSASCGC